MINKDELIYKLETIIEYLKNNGGYNSNYIIDYVQVWENQIQISLNMQKIFLKQLKKQYITNKDKLYLNKYYNYIIKIKGLNELTSFALDF